MKQILFLLVCVGLFACNCKENKETSLRVASYNLRMDTPYDSLNAWSYRKDAVKALIQYHDFDIVGTQEGFVHQLKGICELPEYAYSGSGREDGKEAGEHSAIIYKKEKFTILESGDFWLRETPDEPGLGWDATCCNRICSWVKFKENQSGDEFYFFNVHFDHEGVVARQESGKLMVQKIKEIAQDVPVICTGDFNSTPDTEQIKTLSSFLQDSRKISKLPPYGPEGTFNSRFTHPISNKYRIDYIFVSSSIEVNKYGVLTDQRNNTPYYPSDHQPVVADIVFK
ncbi:endonuclease/exonuclease/phosphatase family metal-dependent hydrolase [Parabacteroides sp. PF5-5]|uniref:endonuclease/exonuclease/phosphatase family protein n=1 Tax=unclassified Parabacteroides TaxID=2649774 RepID=UPI002473CD6B|nr:MULTISPECIES: endonuclease/exonuclease/phosphatase family protein [unclassified Parabacteroides]MDH6303902.1 endonuclease/exonuclease/phosphatase family metal-dependent hydrolase [Parabacteroides sp. PH5-39]MDH6314519.1 endonuclease/exonuclease/phosphatase family metal-dependent hydrolase [Parabacteroides sp. PF5-13]MDH6318416.1 endonuclease/exonuclease/phosphatase family metal-dependent hydrolase [Parabacteroides sp. PH5-13]MDH6322291.1 endonuclease/exonuclease/phosphatase family metal-depe